MQPFEPKPGAAEFKFDFDDATPIEIDDKHWDALMPDDDELDPLPEPGDFWIEFDHSEMPPIAA